MLTLNSSERRGSIFIKEDDLDLRQLLTVLSPRPIALSKAASLSNSASIRESILDDDGKIRFDKAGLLAYAHGEYYALGEKVGKFGFSTKKPSANKSAQKKGSVVEKNPKSAPVSKENVEKENKKRPFYVTGVKPL